MSSSRDKDRLINDRQDSFKEDHLQKALERVAEFLKISDPKYFINTGSKTGDNYVGVLYRIFIEGEKDNVPVKIQTIFKIPPKDDDLRQTLQVAYFFPREHTFYTIIVPIFKEFLESKNKKLEYIPECLFSSVVYYKEVICLEDLSQKGFVMRNQTKLIDFSHASLAFKALGRFHALSFALRDQRPEIFETNIANLKEPLFRPEVIRHSTFIARIKALQDLVKMALAGEDPRYMERFSEYTKDALNKTALSCNGSAAEPYAVLGHGDFWLNNMLFKYEEDSPDPQEVYFLDFQLSRYASPALDIAYSLFANGTHELRKNHFNELLKIYHQSLSSYLSDLGSEPKKLFPYEALLSQLKRFSVYSATMAMLVVPMFTNQDADENDQISPGNRDLPHLKKRIQSDTLFRTTLRDVFKDLIDWNYI